MRPNIVAVASLFKVQEKNSFAELVSDGDLTACVYGQHSTGLFADPPPPQAQYRSLGQAGQGQGKGLHKQRTNDATHHWGASGLRGAMTQDMITSKKQQAVPTAAVRYEPAELNDKGRCQKRFLCLVVDYPTEWTLWTPTESQQGLDTDIAPDGMMGIRLRQVVHRTIGSRSSCPMIMTCKVGSKKNDAAILVVTNAAE
ncbi:hypothetical protein BJV74DRAFT_797712 [Russula compacta]|nr:hypothetical protein BJV74DRAFT_797712 [Russula compacta]